jgi:hypothetical protein
VTRQHVSTLDDVTDPLLIGRAMTSSGGAEEKLVDADIAPW